MSRVIRISNPHRIVMSVKRHGARALPDLHAQLSGSPWRAVPATVVPHATKAMAERGLAETARGPASERAL